MNAVNFLFKILCVSQVCHVPRYAVYLLGIKAAHWNKNSEFYVSVDSVIGSILA